MPVDRGGWETVRLRDTKGEAAAERESPTDLYPSVLAAAFRRTGETLGAAVDDGWARRLGDAVPDWPAFPDSAEALARLARHYSSSSCPMHRAGFAGSNERLQGEFAAIITAEDVGAYKAAENHFRGPRRHAPEARRGAPSPPARRPEPVSRPRAGEARGLPSVWINRRHDRPGRGATPEPTEDGRMTWSSRRWRPSRTRSTTRSAAADDRIRPPARSTDEFWAAGRSGGHD